MGSHGSLQEAEPKKRFSKSEYKRLKQLLSPRSMEAIFGPLRGPFGGLLSLARAFCYNNRYGTR